MTVAFKSAAKAAVGTSPTTVYTAPAATSAVLIGMSACNILSQDITITVDVIKAVGPVTASLTRAMLIPLGQSLAVIGGEQKVVLETGDSVRVTASNASSTDVVLSLMENS